MADGRRKVRFSQQPRPKARRAARPPGGPGARGGAVRALLHLRQEHQGGASYRRRSASCTASPCCASISPGSAPAKASSPIRRFHRISTIWSLPPIICARNSAAPAILIGHSLGGAAVLAAAHRIADARAVVTIGAPFDPAHVTGLFSGGTSRERHEMRSKSRSPAGRSAFAAPCLTTFPQHNLSGAHPRSAQGAAGVSFADRRYRRHRQCEPYFSGGETPQEFHLAGRRRSSAQPAKRCRPMSRT